MFTDESTSYRFPTEQFPHKPTYSEVTKKIALPRVVHINCMTCFII